jgi:hypothetical protein
MLPNAQGDSNFYRRALGKSAFCHDSNACYKEISMNIELNQNALCLKRNQVVTVREGIGHSIVCDSGTVWVTQDGDPRDIILHTGDSFTLDRKGAALVQAFEPGAISITRSTALPRGLPAAWRQRFVAGAGLRRGAVGV